MNTDRIYPDSFTRHDQALFHEGRHYSCYKKMGAHIRRENGVSGVRFCLWAPNAQRVSVRSNLEYKYRPTLRYEVELEQSRLVAPGQEAISDWHTLHDFTLAIRCGKLLTIYRNCEFTELTTRHENGKQLLTHAKLQARHRSCVETAS